MNGPACKDRAASTLMSEDEPPARCERFEGSDGSSVAVITINRDSGKDVSSPKHGKEDPDNMPHVGGNTWAGGTGGRDTAGLGGKGGPYRLDAGHRVYQVSQEEKDAVPEEVKRAAREMGQRAFQQRKRRSTVGTDVRVLPASHTALRPAAGFPTTRIHSSVLTVPAFALLEISDCPPSTSQRGLKEIQMSEYDARTYERFSGAVRRQVHALRIILDNLQAKGKERQWLRHQSTGELDDAKIIDGLTGEKAIYKRRGELEPQLGSVQQKPKRLRLVVDVSGSMYRFNGVDGRLERSMEAVCMVMEAFENYEEKFKVTAWTKADERHICPRAGPELGHDDGEADAGSAHALIRSRIGTERGSLWFYPL
ncbi:hypothetical protein PAL_GLEAN10015255 [Pteropus alecto]|uniref:von Willebrand factor A domain-containing protein 8 n=1 Tax=Pteropus alecto TaxID=9402 RepID=L5KHP6_PTEAL|nr:hypothetical protein PAL_GLEAN10015255 [Pteropus alecto]